MNKEVKNFFVENKISCSKTKSYNLQGNDQVGRYHAIWKAVVVINNMLFTFQQW